MWVVGGRLVEGLIRRAERTEDLIGRNMDETESIPREAGKSPPISERGLQELEGPGNVSSDEFARPVDRTIHMRLGGKM